MEAMEEAQQWEANIGDVNADEDTSSEEGTFFKYKE
jgi:hypothetical protein